ncbi:MAG TPA: copper chaperone PCu(A)C [Gemmatimonadales bacterium]|jgi:copper(I)-binding protein|nr:copper chaperone PCu(A)C [Gemmatimonadales bacterium]
MIAHNRVRLPHGLALLVLLLPSCRTPTLPTASATLGDLQIRQGFAYQPITNASGAAYLVIANGGSAADTLVDASSPIAAMTMFHGASMTSMGSVVIPPGTRVTFAPGGAHIMLTTLSTLPKAGDSLPLTLTFTRAGRVTLELPVREYGSE